MGAYSHDWVIGRCHDFSLGPKRPTDGYGSTGLASMHTTCLFRGRPRNISERHFLSQNLTGFVGRRLRVFGQQRQTRLFAEGKLGRMFVESDRFTNHDELRRTN